MNPFALIIAFVAVLVVGKILIKRWINRTEERAEAWRRRRRKWMSITGSVLRFFGAYGSTMLVFGIPIWICWDWYTTGAGKYIHWIGEIYILWTDYTPVMVALTMVVIFGLSIFYMLVWRMIFPDYMRVCADEETEQEFLGHVRKVSNYEGRVYWIDGYGMSARWARWSGETLEPKDLRPIKVYYNLHRFLNIVIPTRSITKETGLLAGEVERLSPWKIRIRTPGRSITLDDNEITNTPMPMQQSAFGSARSRDTLSGALRRHTHDVRTAAKADVGLAKEQMMGSSFLVPEEIWQRFPAPKKKAPPTMEEDVDGD